MLMLQMNVWNKSEDMLILSNMASGYEMRIYLYGLPIEEGDYQVLTSDGEYKLEAYCVDNPGAFADFLR